MAKKKIRNYNRRKARRIENRRKRKQKVQNAHFASQGGAGGVQDQGGRITVNSKTNHPLDNRSEFHRARIWAELYYKEWSARKIVNIPVDDMLRNRWEYVGLEEAAAAQLEKTLQRVRFNRSLRNALRMERLIGGSVMLMGVKDEEDDPAKPLDYSAIDEGDLLFVNMIPKTRVHVSHRTNDPFKANFGRPETYYIRGTEVHESRLLVFEGDPLTDSAFDDFTNLLTGRDGFGESVLAALYDDMLRSAGARQGAFHLIQRASVLLIHNESLQSQLESAAGEKAIGKLHDIADQMSMFQAAMIDGKKVNLDQWAAQFGSVPELVMSFLQILSAASDIPATRFLGQAPGGLNATGESDLENYYNMIDARRETSLRRNLEKFMRVAIPSTFGRQADPSKVDLEFPPLWNLSETELADNRVKDGNIIAAFVNAGMVDATTAMKEAIAKGVWETEPEGDIEAETLGEDDPLESAQELLDQLGALGGTDAGNNG